MYGAVLDDLVDGQTAGDHSAYRRRRSHADLDVLVGEQTPLHAPVRGLGDQERHRIRGSHKLGDLRNDVEVSFDSNWRENWKLDTDVDVKLENLWH